MYITKTHGCFITIHVNAGMILQLLLYYFATLLVLAIITLNFQWTLDYTRLLVGLHIIVVLYIL